ncbi:TPA: hypothetical protein DCE37_03110 [Candidatus Latescibacteria bacterium]|nr:hypothetical protein [Candidatus Latescibacterota bacterium]
MHARNEIDNDQHEKAAREGAWIAFDGVQSDEERFERDLKHFGEMKKRGLLGQVHLSHEAGYYKPQQGQKYRDHTFIFKTFIGKLKGIGFTDLDIEQVMERLRRVPRYVAACGRTYSGTRWTRDG